MGNTAADLLKNMQFCEILILFVCDPVVRLLLHTLQSTLIIVISDSIWIIIIIILKSGVLCARNKISTIALLSHS